ncbi:MAG: S-layer homology domain-containing protein, partial [Firmicutes bacterium]|nr:S-layer homology domain-containing protein [Bacillota bacterium]
VTITADEDHYTHGIYAQFDHWEVLEGGATLKDPQSRTTTFVMPANDVEIDAVFTAAPNQIMKDVTVKLDKPVAGAKPASTVWCAGANFQSLTWYRWVSTERGIMDWEKMPSTSSFQEGKKYMAEIKLTPQTGQEFAPESELTLTFNGSPSNENIAEWSQFNLIIRKEFTATSPSANPFVDVTESDYFYEPVLWAVKKNITKGTDDTHFSPNDTCTRAQVVTFLWRAAGSPAPSSSVNPFTDVSPSDYYYNAVLWAVGKGITNGLDATTFGSDQGCTRGQVVTFLHRYENTPAPSSYSNPFTDVINGEYYYNAVLWAVGKGITNGLDATTFGPNQTCTRGQIVTFLYRDMK